VKHLLPLVGQAGVLVSCVLPRGIAILFRYGRREAARTAVEFVVVSGAAVLIGVALLFASGSLDY